MAAVSDELSRDDCHVVNDLFGHLFQIGSVFGGHLVRLAATPATTTAATAATTTLARLVLAVFIAGFGLFAFLFAILGLFVFGIFITVAALVATAAATATAATSGPRRSWTPRSTSTITCTRCR